MGHSKSRLDLSPEVEPDHGSDTDRLRSPGASPKSGPEDTSRGGFRMTRARKGFHYLRSRSGRSTSESRKSPTGSKSLTAFRDPVGRSMAHHACKLGDVALREVAKMGVALNAKDNVGVTPAHVAAEHGKSACLETLHTFRVSLEERDMYGQTPAHYAVWHGHLEVVQTLFKLSVDLEVEDEDSRTPAHYAARNKDVGMLQLLAQCGVCMAKRDSRGMLPEHYSPVAFDAIKRFSNAKFARDSSADTSDSLHLPPVKGVPRVEPVSPPTTAGNHPLADNVLDADYLERLHTQVQQKHRRRGMFSSELRPSQLRACSSQLPSTVNEEAEVIDAPLPLNGRKAVFAPRSVSTATTESSLSSPRQPCTTRMPLGGGSDVPCTPALSVSPRRRPTTSLRPNDRSEALMASQPLAATPPAQWGESDASWISTPWESEHSAWDVECSDAVAEDPVENVLGDTLGYEIGASEVDKHVPFVPTKKKTYESVDRYVPFVPTEKKTYESVDRYVPFVPTEKKAYESVAATLKDDREEFSSVKDRISRWHAVTNS